MPWLLLTFGCLSATFTWNAFQPVYAPAFPAVVSFFAGWITSELPLHHVALQAACAIALCLGGGLSAWPGWVGLALLLSSWAGLLLTQKRARESRALVEAALRAGLGPDYAEHIGDAFAPPPLPSVPTMQLWLPFRIAHPEVEVRRDLVFFDGEAADPSRRVRLRLDVYRRRGSAAALPAAPPLPMLIYVHGGAWVIGDKERQGLPLLYHLAARGWLCASISYRLSPRATFPDHLIDVKRAIAWMRAHAAELGGDPALLAIAGGSAGGHLASLAALTPGDPEYQPGFAEADTSVAACVSFYGVYDLVDRHRHYRNRGLRVLMQWLVMKTSPAAAREAWERASPIARVHSGAPPFFCAHGTHDTMVPVEDARRFVAALRAVSRQPVVLAELPGAQHAFELFPSQRTGITLAAVERFLAWVCSQPGDARRGAVG